LPNGKKIVFADEITGINNGNVKIENPLGKKYAEIIDLTPTVLGTSIDTQKISEEIVEKIEEENRSKLDMEIHEHPIVNGSLGIITEKIEHNVNFDHINWKQKHIEYAKWEAKRFSKLNSTSGNNHLTLFQKIKYTILKTPFAGVIFFIGSFVFMLGFIDGLKGLKYNWLKAFYFHRVSTEIKQLNFQ
jgi:hypothetical protein